MLSTLTSSRELSIEGADFFVATFYVSNELFWDELFYWFLESYEFSVEILFLKILSFKFVWTSPVFSEFSSSGKWKSFVGVAAEAGSIVTRVFDVYYPVYNATSSSFCIFYYL